MTDSPQSAPKNYSPVEWPDEVLRKVYASPGSPMAMEAQPTLPPALVWDASHNRYYDPVERRAAEIYATYVYTAGEKPAWTPHGNSLKQDEARNTARCELRDLGHIPVATVVARKIVNDWYGECLNPEEDEPPQFDWPKLIQRIAEAHHRLLTPSTLSQGEGPGAEAVALDALLKTEKVLLRYGDEYVGPDGLLKVVHDAITTLRQPVSVPAPGVTVTDEMVTAAQQELPAEVHRSQIFHALRAALRPKE